ncbi:hypothetical protein FE236_00290 [Mariprofundus erugo]|uniref:hypothetical protein n=1 Tax=Mariprofundus erugo TaxID=2528639 RepID=UPI0010FE6046|nr:hypothetical protein [Mariprofundus erugo]TLS78232.1 hypothetical protein FE236_00290 [Mariprofundus erugo]
MYFQCNCGDGIHDITDTRAGKAHLFSDRKWNAFWDAIDAAIEHSGPKLADKERACMELRRQWHGRALYCCLTCGRL